MPINYSRYPKNWKQISLTIRERANNRCEWPGCGAENGKLIYRDKDEKPHTVEGHYADVLAEDGVKLIKVILTVAHLDNPDPTDCRPENLKALCQLHHLRLDAKLHAVNAAKTRRDKKVRAGQVEMF